MSVNTHNYHSLQIGFFGGSLLIVGLYLALFYGQLLGPGELLGTSPLNLLVAGLHGVYFLLVRGLINQKSAFAAGLADLGLLSLNIILLLLVSGGFASPYFGIWLIVVLASAAFGRKTLAGYVLITAFYLAATSLLAIDGSRYLIDHVIYLLLTAAAGGVGLWLWRHHPDEAETDDSLNNLSQQLKQEQFKSDILFKSIGDAVLVIDLAGTIQLLNGTASILSGWPGDEANGLHYQNVLPLQDEKGQPAMEQNDPFRAAIISKHTVRHNDLLLRNRSGRNIQLSLIISPIFDGGGSVSGAIAVFHDISAEKATERQRDEFISTASHEMRTPVAAIEGFLALAMNPKVASVDENARKYIEKAHASTQHLGQLFRDLLSITKLEDGRLANHPEPFELGKVIKVVTDELCFKTEQKNLELRLKSGSGGSAAHGDVMPLFYVNADPERIREVFVNLVDNAIKFTPSGAVTISLNGDQRLVTVGIHDQGIGIPAGEIDHLFQKFYRVDNTATREIGGTGLGLYLCRQIIELYQGRIWVESVEEQGSNFYFSLPRLSYPQVQELRAKMKQSATADTSANKTVAPNTTRPLQ